VTRHHHGAVLVSLIACGCGCGCAGQQQPLAAFQAAETTEADGTYDEMAIAAASQIGIEMAGKSVGVYRSAAKSSTLREIVTAVIAAYDFREVTLGESRVVCASRRARPVTPSCNIDVADVILQMNSVQITNDSGYVGGLRTEVPPGSDKARTTAFCLLAVRRHHGWEGVRYASVNSPRDCTSDGKH
jgi:hypothetical protein